MSDALRSLFDMMLYFAVTRLKSIFKIVAARVATNRALMNLNGCIGISSTGIAMIRLSEEPSKGADSSTARLKINSAILPSNLHLYY